VGRFIAICVVCSIMVFSSCSKEGGKMTGNAWRETLKSQVAIYRDKWGIPHIYGKTDEATMFGYGYAQAEDRLEAIFHWIIEAEGRGAEFFGEDHLRSDIIVHAFRTPQIVREKYNLLPEKIRRCLEGFAEGINYYMETHPDKVPEYAFPLTGLDIAIRMQRLATVAPTCYACRDMDVEGASIWFSNQFAIAPFRTKEGAAILSMDPHLGYEGSLRWYEADIHAPSMHVYGAGIVGLPVIGMGFTEFVAWCMTSNMADCGDAFMEKLSPDKTKYLYKGQWLPLKVVKERIKVKRPDGKIDEIEKVFKYTHRGPILKEEGDIGYSAATTTFDCWQFPIQVFKMVQARNIAEFKEALAMLQLPYFNIMAVDVEGNIFYIFMGRFPRRPEGGFMRTEPKPGWTGEWDWQGIIPFSELPQIENPPTGWMQNCNVPPQAVTDNAAEYGKNIKGNEEYLEAIKPDNTRGYWMRKVLRSREKHSFEDAKHLAMDEFIVESWVVDLILKAYDMVGESFPDKDGVLARSIEVLRNWDRHAYPDSVGVMLFAQFWKAIGERWTRVNQTNPTEDDAKALLKALKAAGRKELEIYGKIGVRWGDIHRIRRGDKEYEIGGGWSHTTTMRQASGTFGEDGVAFCGAGSSFMMVVQMKKGAIHAESIMPWGESDDPASPHYNDQMELYARDEYKKCAFYDDEVKEAAVSLTSWGYDPLGFERKGGE